LAALAAAIGNSNFKPHVTVARANDDAANLSGAREQFGTLFSPYKSPDFPVREFHLIHSKLYPSGPHYKSIALFPLRPI
jgi:2'-5' RNA ligase